MLCTTWFDFTIDILQCDVFASKFDKSILTNLIIFLPPCLLISVNVMMMICFVEWLTKDSGTLPYSEPGPLPEVQINMNL